ncbi:MAG: holo-ACP synthase [Gammaproteobacteria bacterium]|nr:holo-ACP synthase [Gammaproteobacteria bacterium]
MIIGVGTDIVEVARLAAGLERFGAAYAVRILAPTERAAFSDSAKPAHYLAKRFAAKEAVAKALGCGFRGDFGLRDIAVDTDALGAPRLTLSGGAHQYAARRGVARLHLSLSDERLYAVAFVVLEGA